MSRHLPESALNNLPKGQRVYDLTIHKQDVKGISIRYKGHSWILPIIEPTKKIIEGCFNPISKIIRSEDDDINRALVLICNRYQYTLPHVDILTDIKNEIIEDYGKLGAVELVYAFKLAFKNKLAIGKEKVNPVAYGSPLSLSIVTPVLTAYMKHRYDIIERWKRSKPLIVENAVECPSKYKTSLKALNESLSNKMSVPSRMRTKADRDALRAIEEQKRILLERMECEKQVLNSLEGNKTEL